ncbi:hypothetical protein Tco_0358805, partial [Tanacetum coccineum]
GTEYASTSLEELFNDYDCEIRYHPGKANVVADALSRKERIKLKRVRAMNMNIQSSIKDRILAAQNEASEVVDALAKMLRGLDKQMEHRSDRIRGDDEVELTDKELTKDIEGFKTYKEYKDDWIYEWNKDIPWVDEKPWTGDGVWTKPTPVKHYCKPFNYKTRYSKWPTCSRRNDGFCNGENLPRAYIVRNSLHYQDYEWYEALEDDKLKEEALRNKAIMEGFVNKEDDDESRYEQKKRWNVYKNYDDEYENETHDERQELSKAHKLPMCNMKIQDDQDLVKEISTNIGGEFTNLEILKCWSLETSRRLFNMNSCSINLHGESTEQISGEFLILILFNSRI